MITTKTIGQPRSNDELARALQDMFQTFQLMIAVLNSLTESGSAGQLVFPVVDEDGNVAPYRLVAGAGVTITPDTVARTITITSP